MTMSSTLHITTPSDREIAMTRVFDAPRALVFDAFTKPELVRRWLTGPDGWAFAVCDIDLRAGGKYRYVWRKAGVPDMGMGGEFREVVPPERVVWTFEYVPLPGHISVETMTLAERDGRTLLTVRDQFSSKEDLEGMVNSGMESGARESYERLDELIAELNT